MPPRIAQPCRFSRVLLRALPLPRPAYSVALPSTTRFQHHDGAAAPLQYPRIRSSIIIPRSVTNTQPEDLIKHIGPVSKRRLNHERFIVLLLTPVFAHWLHDDHVFLEKALRQAYQHAFAPSQRHPIRLHALCAVVDKLPTPTSVGDDTSVDLSKRSRAFSPPVSETGYEGLAYTCLRNKQDSIELPSSAVAEKGAISFVAIEGTEEKGFFTDTLQVPLANTVFQTGSPTTMHFTSWQAVPQSNELKLTSKTQLSNHGIKLHRGGSTTRLSSALAVPLVPLTQPRQVHASMGNILRQVVGPDGKPMTASQELEQVVPQYFKSRGDPQQATSVWALVIPNDVTQQVLEDTAHLLKNAQVDHSHEEPADLPESSRWEKMWASTPPIWNTIIQSALTKGARLHRVLSGGGGWGKKAGLLSLDPVANSTESEVNARFDSVHDPEELSSALQQVAQENEFIQFFISPSVLKPNGDNADAQVAELQELENINTPWHWELGTVPSTVDSLEENTWQRQSSDSKECFVFKHSFGALSEGALSLRREFKLKLEDPVSAVSSTKVDVPFSRFSFLLDKGLDEKEADKDTMQNYVQADRFRYDHSLVSNMYGEHSPPLFNLVPRPWNPESKREEENSVPIRYIETVLPQDIEEHTAPHVDTKVPPVTKTAKTSVPTKSTLGLVRKVQPLPVSSDANERQPLVFRKYTWRDSIDPEATAAYFQNRKQQRSTLKKLGKYTGSIQLAVHDLTTNARQMMADIHQRTRLAKRHHSVYVSMANFLQNVQAENKRYRFLYFLDKLSSDAALLDAHFFILEREAQYLFSSRARSLVSKLEDFTTRMGDRIEHYDHIFSKTVSKIVLYTQVRTQLFDLANNSAVDVYNLNIALRHHLAAMLTARQRHKLPHPMARGIPPLETKLVALRVFAENLFANPDAAYTPAEIRHHLNDIEARDPTAAALELSSVAKWKLRMDSMGPEARERERANARLRRIRENPSIRGNPKIRKELVSPAAMAAPKALEESKGVAEVQKHPGADPRVRIRKFSAKPLPEDREVWRPFLEHRLRVVGTRMEHEEEGLERRGVEEEGQGGDDEVSREELMEMWREQVKSLKKRDVLRQVSGWIGGVQTGKFNNNLLGADFKGRRFGEDSSPREDTEGRKGIDV